MRETEIPAELRDRAAELRRLAQAPTSGGHRANRMLLQMARRLEDDAARIEREASQ